MNNMNIGNIDLLFLGDSYTIGENISYQESYPFQLKYLLERNGYNIENQKLIAKTGWRTDNLLDAIRLQNIQSKFDYVFLLIGVNNQYQGRNTEKYAFEFKKLVDISINLCKKGEENVIVISIPDYGFSPQGKEIQEQISKEIDIFNNINLEISKSKNIKRVNIAEISRNFDKTLFAEDQLHPSGKQYRMWSEQILNIFIK